MPTGNNRTNFVDKRHLPQQRVKDTFFDYLLTELREAAIRIWGFRRGVYGTAVLQGDGTDRFKVSSVPVQLLDGGGNILILDAAAAQQIYFENALGVDYYAAAKHCLIPSGIERNPRTGVLFYDLQEDSVGVSDVPDSVTQVGGTLEIKVDAIFEAGVSHAGRKVTVWLNSPKTLDESVAIERDLVVAWVGGENVVTTVGLLGQGAVSTSPGDYTVAATGITVRRNTDLRNEVLFAFLGIVTGAGAGVQPALFNTSDQIDVTAGLNPTLDLAYDGGPLGFSGSGRTIRVDNGAVELITENGEGDNDPGWAQLRLTRPDSTEWAQFMYQAICGDISHIPIAALQPVREATGTTLIEAEPATLSGANTITLDRVGVDLTDAANRINAKLHVVLVEDCPQAGLYVIDTFGVNTIDVLKFDGAAPGAWPAGSATVRILVPRFVVAGSQPANGKLDWWAGPLLVLREGYAENPTDLRVMPEGAGRIVLYDNSLVGGTYYEPRELLVIDPSEVGQDLKWPTRFRRSVLIRGGNVTGAPGEESAYDRDGLRIYDAGGDYAARDPALALSVDYGFPEDVPALHTWPSFAVDVEGAVNRGHHLRDDFLAHPLGAIGATLGPYYTAYAPNPGTAFVRDIYDGAGFGHGAIELVTGNTIGDIAEFGLDVTPFNLDTDYDFRWTYRARLKLPSLADVQVIHGFHRSSVNRRFYFIFDSTTGFWYGAWMEPDTSIHLTAALCGATVDEYQWFEIRVGVSTVTYSIERKDHAVGSYGSAAGSITSLSGQAGALGIRLWQQTAAAAEKASVLDYWEVWDREILRARFGTSHNLNHP